MANERPILRFGAFELDAAAGELRRQGRVVKLRAQPFALLTLLCERPGQLVSRAEIQRRLWGEHTTVEFDQGINHCIRQVRAALGDNATSPRFLETVPGQGYRFVADVREVAPATTEAPEPAAPRRLGARHARLAVLGALALAAVFGAWRAATGRGTRDAGAGPAHTLAVLPFRHAGTDERAQHLSEGLTHELISGLGRRHAPRLAVVARTSVNRFVDADTPADAIGRALGADVLLEGTVRSDGDRVRVTAALVRARDHVQLWSETYERRFDDALAVESEVAAAIASALALPLDPARVSAGEPPRTIDPAATDAYLAGRYLLARPAPDAPARALEHLEKAIAIAPDFAVAHAALARALMRSGRREDARRAAQRAAALDPMLVEPHVVLGNLAFYGDFDPEAAGRSFERALAINPGLAEGYHAIAAVHSVAGRHDAALAAIARAVALDPLSPMVRADVGWYAYFARRYDLAVRGCAGTLELEPDFDWAHRCLLLATHLGGDSVRFSAAAVADMSRRRAAPDAIAHVASGGPAGERAYWSWDLAELDRPDAPHRSPADRAVTLLALGEEASALAALEDAVATGRSWLLPFLGVDPMFDGVRDDLRFRNVTLARDRLAARRRNR